MSGPRLTWALAAIVATVATVAFAPVTRAETLVDVVNPRPQGHWVSDMAGVLSGDAVGRIDAIAESLKVRHGAELTVVTVHNTFDQEPKAFATALLNLWGVGRKGVDDGVLMLVVVDAHRVEVETGYGAEAVLPDARVGRILDRYVVPSFKQGDWDAGVIGGVGALAEALASGTADEPPSPARRVLPFAAGGTASLGAAAALLAWRRSRERTCERCHRRMRRLTREQERAYLSADESLEESLTSVDHVVWRCDECQVCHIEHHRRWLSAYDDCPKCGRRTLATVRHTLVEATYESAGSAEVTQTCKKPGCGYTRTHRETLARLEQSSSSSSGSSWSGSSSGGGGGGGGSFGGGSSGGGGAGRSW